MMGWGDCDVVGACRPQVDAAPLLLVSIKIRRYNK